MLREPTHEDRERLLNIPIRRISRFDIAKNQEEIAAYQAQAAKVEKELKNIKKVTIRYLQGLLKSMETNIPGEQKFKQIEQLDRRAIETRQITVGFDPASGFIGTKVPSSHLLECTNFDKLVVMFKDGTYTVINIPEKQYVHHEGNKVVFLGVADKKTIMRVAYRNPETHHAYAKRFIIEKFILDKTYRYLEEGMILDFISTDENITLELQLIPKPRQQVTKVPFKPDDVAIKGVTAKGVRMTPKEVKKVVQVK